MKLFARTSVLAVLAVIAASAPAQAATWKQVTAPGGTSVQQIAQVRTSDGVLHVAWRRPAGPSAEDLMHTTITPSGTVGGTSPIVTGWAGLANPGLISGGDGLRVFFGGLRSTDSADPNNDLNTARSGDGGASWELTPYSIVPLGTQAYGSSVSAAPLAGDGSIQAYAGTLGTWVHSGLDPAVPSNDLQGAIGAYGYDPGVASDGTQTWVAWYSNAQGNLGVKAQAINPDGTPAGGVVSMPSTSDMEVGQLTRTPIAARAGGGFYVAYATGYPSQNVVRVWRIGAGAAPVLGKVASGGSLATIAAAPDGRLWVAWKEKDDDGAEIVVARRSNKAGSVYGALVKTPVKRGAGSIYSVDASATATAVDVLANYGEGTEATSSTSVTRLLPGLSLKANKSLLKSSDKTEVTFTVLDAGDPVSGARVSAGGDSGTTSSSGKVTLDVGGSAKYATAKATKSGYVAAEKRIRRSSR